MSPGTLGFGPQVGQILWEALPATDLNFHVCSPQQILFHQVRDLEKQRSHCILDYIIHKLSFYFIDSGKMTLPEHVSSALEAPPLQHLGRFTVVIYLLDPLDNKHFDVGDCILFLPHFPFLLSWLASY